MMEIQQAAQEFHVSRAAFIQKIQSTVPQVHVFGRRRKAAEVLVSRTVSMDNISQENTLADEAEHWNPPQV